MAVFSDLTEEQQKNLCTLRDYIKDLYGDARFHENFNMAYCCRDKECHEFYEDGDLMPREAICGTTCCVLGHGPQAGIDPGKINDWKKYAILKFGQDCDLNFNSWDFIFHENWRSDIQFAIWRLDQYINGRDVEGFSFEAIDDEYFNHEPI